MGSYGDQRCVKISLQICDGKVTSRSSAQLQRDVSSGEDLPYLCFNHITRQAILRKTQIEHAPSHLGCLKDGDRIAHQREVMCCRQTYRTSADNGNAESEPGLGSACVYIDRAS